MDKKTARYRWTLGEGIKRGEALVETLRKGRTSERHLLKHTTRTEEGLIDLRGLSFGRVVEFERARFRDLDFSYTHFGHPVFTRCTFERVSLKEIDSDRWNERGCRFTDADFYKANLRGAGIGIDGSTYLRVSFREADFSGAHFYRGQFTDCDFSDARLRKIDFYVSNFVNCKFRGRLESVWFRRCYPLPSDERTFGKAVPNEMRNVDFSEAELWEVMYTGGLDLSHVILPQDGNHILLCHFDVALTKVRDIMDTLAWSEEDKKRVMISVKSYLVFAHEQPMKILNKREICGRLGEQVGAEFIALLEKFDASAADG
jgi:uncharacterized protein YjbI with pentapeptide repeats